jgi:hypothetical protein
MEVGPAYAAARTQRRPRLGGSVGALGGRGRVWAAAHTRTRSGPRAGMGRNAGSEEARARAGWPEEVAASGLMEARAGRERQHVAAASGGSTLFTLTTTCDSTFERYFYMIHMVGNFWKSSFSCNKRDIFWTSELGDMTNLVEAAQTSWWLRENCRRLHKFSTNMTFHMLLLVLIFTPN